MKKIKKILIVVSIVLFASIYACTDLETKLTDSVLVESSEGAFTGGDAASLLQSGYVAVRDFGGQENVYALSEVTSDEYLVPTRGTDWGDNGIWRSLHYHSWTPTHNFLLATWNQLNSAVFTLNQLLASETGADASQLAQGKFLRAYHMFWDLDLWGKAPFRGVNDGIDVDPSVMEAQELFDFIITDLTEALPDLATGSPASDPYIANRAAANFLLAKLYLNRFIYLGETSPSTDDMNNVIQYCDAVTTDGYSLHGDFFEIFNPNFTNTEVIFAADTWTGNRMYNGLHYTQGGWNGFSTLGEIYNSLEASDERIGFVPTNGTGYGFLIGQQYADDGSQLKQRSGNPLIYTIDYPNGLTGNTEATGIRILKYHPSAEGNNYILMRYSDVRLMKAEAILRGGTSGETAKDIVNELQTLRGASLTTPSLNDMLTERARELYIEGWRRMDQRRFGTFTTTWDMKDNTEEFRDLFPIPANAMNTNPNLTQNPGY